MTLAPRWHGWMLALLTSAGLAVFAAYDLYREYGSEVAQSRANTANVTRLLEAYTHQNLQRTEALLARAGARVRRAVAAAAPDLAVSDDLRAMLPADRLVAGLVWLDANGQVLATSLTLDERVAAQALLQDWQVRHRADPAARITLGRHQSVGGGRWWMPVGQAGGRGQPGALVALIDAGVQQAVLDAVDTGRNGFVTLFLRDGWIWGTAPRKEALFAKSWVDSPMFRQHLPKSPFGTVQQVVVRDGTERIYSYRALSDYPVVVAYGMSLTDALADWRNRIVWDSVLLAIVCGALGLAAWGMQRSTTRREAAEADAAQLAGQARDVIAAARDQAERSEHFLRDITDNLPMHVAYVDTERRYGFVNRALSEHIGLPREAILGKTRQDLGLPPLPAEFERAVDRALQGLRQRVELEVNRGGPIRSMEVHLVPDQGADGRVPGIYLAAGDITERQAQQAHIQQALAERETLLREVYHRVKNNLQVVQSLLNLQRRALPEGSARAALDDSVQRVQAMALVHEKLYQTGNLQAIALPDYTADLLRHLGDAADASRNGITLSAHIDPVESPLQDAVPFGLLVSELVMNSLKHAFPAGRNGHIEVRLQRLDQGVVLTVQDNGIGLPAEFELAAAGGSMGLQLAVSLGQQLGGDLQAHRLPDGGTRFSATLTRLNPADPAELA